MVDLFLHVADPRWREVILLTVGMSMNADYLLSKMKLHVDKILADKQFNSFIEWLLSFFKDFKLTTKESIEFREFYFCLSCIELDLQVMSPGENNILRTDMNLVLSLELAKAIYSILGPANSLSNFDLVQKFNSNFNESCHLLREKLEISLKDISDSKWVAV